MMEPDQIKAILYEGNVEILIRENERLRTELYLYRLFSIVVGLLWIGLFVLSILR